jgi:hypothetical protein
MHGLWLEFQGKSKERGELAVLQSRPRERSVNQQDHMGPVGRPRSVRHRRAEYVDVPGLRLSAFPLAIVSTVLTSFNDNAAITYLSTLVPNLTDALKYAVVAGAVTGGGLTVIANAPNPAGQAILNKHFDDGIAPAGLLKAAFVPTVIMFLAFAVFA